MRDTMKTKAAKDLNRQRKQGVEPVFGIIKSAMGFRGLQMRGLAPVKTEWSLVALAYNAKRLANLAKA
jgi:hypothetical protein